MYILGIESSCDETAVSISKDGTQILSSVVSTQIEEHKNSKHTPVSEPVHKMITPVLIRRETTERDLLAEDN